MAKLWAKLKGRRVEVDFIDCGPIGDFAFTLLECSNGENFINKTPLDRMNEAGDPLRYRQGSDEHFMKEIGLRGIRDEFGPWYLPGQPRVPWEP